MALYAHRTRVFAPGVVTLAADQCRTTRERHSCKLRSPPRTFFNLRHSVLRFWTLRTSFNLQGSNGSLQIADQVFARRIVGANRIGDDNQRCRSLDTRDLNAQ